MVLPPPFSLFENLEQVATLNGSLGFPTTFLETQPTYPLESNNAIA